MCRKEEKEQKILKSKNQKQNGKHNHKHKKGQQTDEDDDEVEGETSNEKPEANDYDEDLEYYKQEIGQEPDSGKNKK